MKHTYLAGTVFLIVFIGAILFTHYDKEGAERIADTSGTYTYTCADGAEFSIIQSSDMATIKIMPGKHASFSVATLKQATGTQQYAGEGMSLAGAGEHIRLGVSDKTLECDPVPSQDMAPFNWGDPAEGAGAAQNSDTGAQTSIVGKWQSNDDARFTREFQAGGKEIDRYDGQSDMIGTWKIFSSAAPLKVPFEIVQGVTYVQIAVGSDPDPLNFSISAVTPERLEMTYMARGNTLSFKRVQ